MIDDYLNELAAYRENRNSYNKEERKLIRAALRDRVDQFQPGELQKTISGDL